MATKFQCDVCKSIKGWWRKSDLRTAEFPQVCTDCEEPLRRRNRINANRARFARSKPSVL